MDESLVVNHVKSSLQEFVAWNYLELRVDLSNDSDDVCCCVVIQTIQMKSCGTSINECITSVNCSTWKVRA
ncbi:hypothetical protein ACFX1Q_010535 [Malus domestica]